MLISYINNGKIPFVNHVKHLGHVLSNRNSDILDIDYKYNYIISCFNRSVNIMLANLGALPSSILGNWRYMFFTLVVLFLSYCCSFYGVTLCNIRSNSLQKMYVAWRKAICRIYRVPIRTHSALLPYLPGRPAFEDEVKHRVLNFYTRLKNLQMY